MTGTHDPNSLWTKRDREYVIRRAAVSFIRSAIQNQLYYNCIADMNCAHALHPGRGLEMLIKSAFATDAAMQSRIT